ncbi:MAG: SDR family oxidoreductase [bacterium]|nr:SDR family oxidoreductase [bacterium]
MLRGAPKGGTVLLVGGTGRTGQRVLCRLLERGVAVRAVVRSAGRLPPGVAGDPRLTVVEADLLALDDEGLAAQVRGCEAVVSCLGHTISLRGVFGPPHDLVARATARLCGAIRDSRPAAPVKFILMSSVSVDHPGTTDERRTDPERLLLRVLRRLVPPARDNQRAADFLHAVVGTEDPHVRWAVVRPDTLREGEVSAYALHEHPVSSLFKPDDTRMSNVADFMCDLATVDGSWGEWAGRLPVIVDRN